MSRYYSFNDFMNDVIKEADRISKDRNGCGLENLYTKKINWMYFVVVVILLIFLLPVGILGAIVIVIMLIRKKYRDDALPKIIKNICEEYKYEWNLHEGNRVVIDRLMSEASEALYQFALNS